MIHNKDQKGHYMIGMIAIFICLYFIGKAIYENWKLKKEGVYVIASFNKLIKGGKTGPSKEYTFKFGNHDYFPHFSDLSPVDTYKYYLILPSKPSVNRVLFDQKVLPCLKPKDVPANGWKTLPSLNICD